MDVNALFKQTRFSVKLPTLDFTSDATISTVLNSQARKIVFRGEKIRAYLIAQLSQNALEQASQAKESFSHLKINTLNSSNASNNNSNSSLSSNSNALDPSRVEKIKELYSDKACQFFYGFRIGITAYVSVVKNLETIERDISKRQDSILSTTTVENKVPISIQVGRPSEPNIKPESDRFPFMLEWNSQVNEWVAVYEFNLSVSNPFKINNTLPKLNDIFLSQNLETNNESIELEIRVTNQFLNDSAQVQDSNLEIDSKNINSQIISLGDISSWVVKEQNVIKNLNMNISQLGECTNPQNLITQRPLNQTLLSSSNSQLKMVYSAEDIDKNALVSVPQRLFFTSIKSIPLISLGYRLVQSAPFCGSDSLYLEVVAVNNSHLATNNSVSSKQLPQTVKLSSLRLNPINLFLTRLSNLDSFDSGSKSVSHGSENFAKSHLNSLECFKEPKTLAPGEIWSEIFCISISSFKTANKNLKRSESIFHSVLNGDISESQLSNYGNDSKLTIVAEGSMIGLPHHSIPSDDDTKEPDLLEHRIDVDILSLIESSQINQQAYQTPNGRRTNQNVGRTPIDHFTASLIQTYGGFGEGSGIKDSLNYKHITQTVQSDGFYDNSAFYVSNTKISSRSNLPQIIFSPLTTNRPHLPTNFMEKQPIYFNADSINPNVLQSYSIDVSQSHPVKVTVTSLPHTPRDIDIHRQSRGSIGRIRLGSITNQALENRPPRIRSITSFSNSTSPAHKALMHRKMSKASPSMGHDFGGAFGNFSQLPPSNSGHLLSNLTSQLNPMFEKFTKMGISNSNQTSDYEYGREGSKFSSPGIENPALQQDAILRQYNSNPLISNLRKLNRFKQQDTADGSSTGSSKSHQTSPSFLNPTGNPIRFADHDDSTGLETSVDDSCMILISISADSQVKLGEVVNVVVTVVNNFPFVLSGLSICSKPDESDSFDLQHYGDMNRVSEEFMFQGASNGDLGLDQIDAPFRSNLWPLDQVVDLRPIFPGMSETVTMRYIASDLEFCSIGDLYLYLSSDESSDQSITMQPKNQTSAFQYHSAQHNSGYDPQYSVNSPEKSLIAEFETPLLIFVE